MRTHVNYDREPFVSAGAASECIGGWRDVMDALAGASRICIECYPGVFIEEIARAVRERIRPAELVLAEDCYLAPEQVDRKIKPYLTDDPVFGRMNKAGIGEFLDPVKVAAARERIAKAEGTVVAIGAGASIVMERFDVLLYANMPRWEIQRRQRANLIGNLGADNKEASAAAKYKRAFFVDWRAADRLKRELYDRMDFVLDTSGPAPKMIRGEAFRRGLAAAVQRPFRVVPFFDPGPWGGQWMRQTFGLPENSTNYAWCFDCVPEENSLLLGFGAERVEMPAIDLVFRHPRELLGEDVYARFGTEFPIRFDLLDTWQGGNLSLQVHPLTEYIRERFGMAYTQDESYYLLDCGEGASVYLGLREGIDREAMAADLARAQSGVEPFDAEKYVNRWPARKHDHFLIPAGTVHCSGANSVVLEISATPYIFTFKLWDWDRLDLNGNPRPIHLEHGLNNIQWRRTTAWVKKELVGRVEPLGQGDCWREERTGLHELEFIETRRHWFTGAVPHDTDGAVNVLNLVEGNESVVESPSGAFEPFHVHYAETFIVPAAVGRYTIRPAAPGASPCATLKAYVRSGR